MDLTSTLRNPKLWPGMIITAGAVVRAWNLTNQPLWYDESFTVLVAKSSLANLIIATAGDVHPPLYYLLIKALLILPLSPVLIIRGFSLLLGVANLVLFWKVSARFHLSDQARLAALVIFTFLPIEVIFSAEGRMYALLQFMLLVQLNSIVTLNYPILLISTILALYSHNYALIYSPLVYMAGMLIELTKLKPMYRPGVDRWYQDPWAKLMFCGFISLAVFVPWLVVLAGQMSQVANSYWIEPVTLGGLILILHKSWVGFYQFDNWAMVSLITFTAVLALIFLNGVKHKRFMMIWLGFGPMALAVLISIVWKPMLLHRGLIGCMPYLAALAGESFTLAKGAGKVGRWALAAPWVIALITQIGLTYTPYDHNMMIWPQQIPAEVYHIEDTSLILFLANHPDTKSYLIDTGCPAQRAALTPITRAALGIKTVKVQDLPPGAAVASDIGPYANRCMEDAWRKLIEHKTAMAMVDIKVAVYGVWYGK